MFQTGDSIYIHPPRIFKFLWFRFFFVNNSNNVNSFGSFNNEIVKMQGYIFKLTCDHLTWTVNLFLKTFTLKYNIEKLNLTFQQKNLSTIYEIKW